MPKIVPIVEGDGETQAVPGLLYRILQELNRWDIQIEKPKEAKGCDTLLATGGLERFVQLAWAVPECVAVLILIDADERCPKETAADFTRRIQALGVHRSVAIVFAKCEFEAWFLASLETIAGKELSDRPGLPANLRYEQDVETKRGVKEWLSNHFPRGRSYKPSEDQLPMTRLLDIALVRERSRSFRRLYHALEEVIEAMDTGKIIVTPQDEKR